MTFTRTTDARLVRSFLSEPNCGPDVSYVVAVEAGAIARCLFMLCSTDPATAEVRYWIPSEVKTFDAIDGFVNWVWKETSLQTIEFAGGPTMRRPE